MPAPNLTTARRFPQGTRLRLQLVFARAWEALAGTYSAQAAEFVRRLHRRLGLDAALDRYFHEVGVPAAMAETVRARAYIAVADLIRDPVEADSQSAGWGSLRPDQMLGALKRRAQHVEETGLECRLAASLCGEAVARTHLRMALETADLLSDEATPDEAIMLYVRAFNLPSLDAQLVFRRAMAQMAERTQPATAPELTPVCASAPHASFGAPVPLVLRLTG